MFQNTIALLSAYTNLDVVIVCISFVLANNLGMDNHQFLNKQYSVSRNIFLTTNTEDAKGVLRLLNYYSAEEAHYHKINARKGALKHFEAIIDKHNVSPLKRTLEKEGLIKKGSFQEIEMATPTNNFGLGE